MTRHQCRPTCPACVRDVAQARALARAELLPRLTRTVRVIYTNRPKEGTRESAA